MEKNIIKGFGGPAGAVYAVHFVKLFCGFIAHEHGGKSADAHFHRKIRRSACHFAFAVGKANGKAAVVPRKKPVVKKKKKNRRIFCGLHNVIVPLVSPG